MKRIEVHTLFQFPTVFTSHDERAAITPQDVRRTSLFDFWFRQPERAAVRSPRAEVNAGVRVLQRIEGEVMRLPFLRRFRAERGKAQAAAAAAEHLDFRLPAKFPRLDTYRDVILPERRDLHGRHHARVRAFGIGHAQAAVVRLKNFINEPVRESLPSGKTTNRPPSFKYSAMRFTA